MPAPKDPVKYEDWRTRISNAKKGKTRFPMSDEQRQKLSEANKGKIKSEEHRLKLSGANKGKIKSEEHRLKLSEANKGKIKSEEQCLKLSEANKGKIKSEDTRRKLAEYCGERASRWKGGISFEPYCVKFNNEFKERVRAFFGHQCVECGKHQEGKKLSIHHVNFDKQSCCNETLPLFVPLCHSCHPKTNKNRDYWQRHFTEIINTNYEGKCYYTKEEMTVNNLGKCE